MIDKERVLQEFIELVAIPSSGRAERQIADALKRKLTEIGLAVEEDATGAKIGGNAGNLIASLKYSWLVFNRNYTVYANGF